MSRLGVLKAPLGYTSVGNLALYACRGSMIVFACKYSLAGTVTRGVSRLGVFKAPLEYFACRHVHSACRGLQPSTFNLQQSDVRDNLVPRILGTKLKKIKIILNNNLL